MAGSDPFITLARIGAPNGVRGAVRVKLFGDDPAGLVAHGPLLRADGRGSLAVEDMRPGKTADLVIASFKGITDRDQAAALNGVELGLPRSALPQSGEDEFYHADLIGLEARLKDGTRFGRVLQVANFGADDLLDIKADRGGPSVLVPFTRAVVPVVDLAEGFLLLDPPGGLLDPPKAEADQPAEGADR